MKNKLKLLRIEGEGEEYSYYENPDAELVKQIKAVPIPTEFDYLRFEKKCSLRDIIGDKYLIGNADNDMMTISKEQYDEAIHRQHLEDINHKFLVSDTFNQYYAPYELQNDILVLSIRDDFAMNRGFGVGREVSFYTGVDLIFDIEETYFGVSEEKRNYWDDEKIEGNVRLHIRRSSRCGHMYFNENGEIVNRNYNLNFNPKTGCYVRQFMGKSLCIENFLDYFKKFDGFEYAKGVWYTPEFAFKPIVVKDDEEIIVEKLLFDGKVYKGFNRWNSKVKKPKKVEIVTTEHLINKLKELVQKLNNEDYGQE